MVSFIGGFPERLFRFCRAKLKTRSCMEVTPHKPTVRHDLYSEQGDNYAIQERPERESRWETQSDCRGTRTCPRVHRRGSQNARVDNDESQFCTSGQGLSGKRTTR